MGNVSRTKTGAVWCLTFFLVTVAFVRASEATPLTWLYVGSVGSTFDQNLLPVGSPVTALLTVDPQRNVWDGNLLCGSHPEGGGYLFQAQITLNGQSYSYSGALEPNYDFTFCHSHAGSIRVVPFELGGPPLGGIFPPGTQGNQSGAYIAGQTDPASSAFPSSGLGLILRFSPFIGERDVRIGIGRVGLVPEPATMTLVLVGTGAMAAARRRRLTDSTNRN